MEKIALVVTIEFNIESEADFMSALINHKERCLKSEVGTLGFEIMRPTDSQNTVILFELYENSNALSVHDSGSSLSLFKEQAWAFILKASAKHCKLV